LVQNKSILKQTFWLNIKAH